MLQCGHIFRDSCSGSLEISLVSSRSRAENGIRHFPLDEEVNSRARSALNNVNCGWAKAAGGGRRVVRASRKSEAEWVAFGAGRQGWRRYS